MQAVKPVKSVRSSWQLTCTSLCMLQQSEGRACPRKCLRYQGEIRNVCPMSAAFSFRWPLINFILQMALFGQAPEAIMQTALAAINFYTVQQQVVSNFRETRLADKAIQMKEQCNKKLQEVHHAYQNVKSRMRHHWKYSFIQLACSSAGLCLRNDRNCCCWSGQQIHHCLLQAKRKYQAVAQEKSGLEQETRELQDKYRQKSK